MADLKAAIRSLTKQPGFSIVAILTIAVGIGANTTLFSVYDRLVLNPVTIADSSTLVALLATNQQFLGVRVPAVSWPRYEEIRDQASSFASVALSAFDNFTLTGNGDPQQLNGLRITPTFFPTLGVMPALGRNFAPQEDVPNGAAVCIISHELWQTQFGGRTDLLGTTIALNGQSWEVVGIMPPRLTAPFGQTQIFAPRVFEVPALTMAQVQAGSGYAQPIARLKPGVTLERAKQELAAISKTSHDRFPARLDANNTIEPQLFVESIVGALQPTFYTLLGAVGFVLLIACANVASLFLGRLLSRHREIAVRQSLGATRADVVRQFLVESAVFSTIAGALGVAIAVAGLRAVQSLIASQLPPNATLTLNWRAVLFTAAATLVCSLLVGLAPAWHASRSSLVDALKDAARGSSSERSGRFRSILIVAEVALSVVLLVGSALLLVSFIKLQQTPPGFEARGAATAFVAVPTTRYKTAGEQAEFFERVIERLHADPQVTEAAAVQGLPLSGFNPRAPYTVAGQPVLPLPQRPIAGFSVVSEEYFRLMRIGFVEGRAFTPADREGAPMAGIINESFARKLFPGQSAIGKRLLRGKDANIEVTIVGVIHDVKTNGLNAPAPDEIYQAMRQFGRPGLAIVARTTGEPAALQRTIRAAVADVDKDQPISFFTTLETNVANSLGVQRIVSSLTMVFAGLALALSAVGLYSVLAYAVSQRTPEIGIRMALGAQSSAVVAMVMRSGLRLVAIGLVLGLAGAAAAASLIRTLLFNVQPIDPLIYSGVAFMFTVVATLACLVPSIKASRVDPLIALRAG
jgi:putative ABC transport system permease protein